MATSSKPRLQNKAQKLAEELKAIIMAKYPAALFVGPYYFRDEGVWLLDAYSNAETISEVGDLVSEKELEIHLNGGICISVIPVPLASYPNEAVDRGAGW